MPNATIFIRPDIALANALVASHPSTWNLTNAVYAEPDAGGEDAVDVRVGLGRDLAVTLGTETTATGAGHATTVAAGNAVGAGPAAGGDLILSPGASVGGGAAGQVRIPTAGLNVGGSAAAGGGGAVLTTGLVVGYDGVPAADAIRIGDANASLALTTGEVILTGDSGNDRLRFVRAANNWNIEVAGGAQLLVGPTQVIVNETGTSTIAFRAETDTRTHALYVDPATANENVALLAASAPSWGGMRGGVFLGNVTTAPTSNPSGGGFLYASGGALQYRASAGTITTLAAADPHCPRCGADFALQWRNARWGHLAVCMPCLVGALGAAGIAPAQFLIPEPV